MLRSRLLPALRALPMRHARSFGFSSSASSSPSMNIPMPYIEETSAALSHQVRFLPSATRLQEFTASLGMAIYDTMTYIKSPVATVCIGGAASMAAILLAGGAAGQRCALPHSSIMIHQPLGGTRGQASDILIYANQIQRIREQSNQIMQYHLNKAKGFDKYSLEEINDLMERDKYLSVTEALELGVIDEIFSSRKDKDNKPKKEQEGEEGKY
ncbi:atp-dependent clp protease proteolytic subunit [Trichoderma arundinaceum]|uniref:ATP-dependent Clp protease proteolytic subunit n=1 Tax=Trichoderma arundinaceum TaxID=490622 RepID=A0A395P2Q0_TRIAR|nr:atp-dependent clp protease proteolytic subunit [Trichoderma arundinaceum]